MTAVSLINPYAPQPVAPASAEPGINALQSTPPAAETATDNTAGDASDQSGQGAGNGTGTGGAQLSFLLNRARDDAQVQRATPESVIEAQSETQPAAEYLERQAELRVQARAAEEQRAADIAAAKADAAKAEAAKAAEPDYEMPNPLPTAPILQTEDG